VSARGVLRIIEGGHRGFWCPGCEMMHVVKVEGSPAWGFNGDHDRPTFTPSVLAQGTQRLTDDEHARVMRGEAFEPRPLRCHSFVRDGQIEFLSDCTHALAGQTVPLKSFDQA
jgi:hypothetical protein